MCLQLTDCNAEVWIQCRWDLDILLAFTLLLVRSSALMMNACMAVETIVHN